MSANFHVSQTDRDYLVTLRRDFHSHPELGLEEFRTAQRIEEELDRMGISHRRVGETGVLGILHGTAKGRGVIALRGDIDALPIQETNETPYRSQTDGITHACGHDVHTACLLGGAKILSENRDQFGGEVRLIFQPGEEIGQGAKPFLEKGELDHVERVFALHTAWDLPIGTIGLKPGLNNAAVDFFRITVAGKSAHVSTPQLGVDALYLASQIVVSVQALVTRRTSPVEPVLIGIGKLTAGTAYNAIAAEAVLEGTTRTITKETREQVHREINALVQQTAGIYGGTAEIEWTDYASAVINDANVCKEVTEAIQTLGGGIQIQTQRPLSLGGDNFAEFLNQVPGVYAHLGTANAAKPGTQIPAHNGNFDIDEDSLSIGAGLYAAYAIHWLTKGERV